MVWNLQAKNDMWDAINTTRSRQFACIMQDGQLVEATALLTPTDDGIKTEVMFHTTKTYYKNDIVLWVPIPRLQFLDPCKFCRLCDLCDKDMCTATIGDIVVIRSGRNEKKR